MSLSSKRLILTCVKIGEGQWSCKSGNTELNEDKQKSSMEDSKPFNMPMYKINLQEGI